MPEFITFTLGIDGGNAAFDENPHDEIATILRKAADRITGGASEGKLLDANGNTVGSFEIELGDDESDEDEDDTEHQDEAEGICANVEELYLSGREDDVDTFEFKVRAWHDAQRFETFDPDKVDFRALQRFLKD